eukprot:3255662-Amphidinium_carterae.1
MSESSAKRPRVPSLKEKRRHAAEVDAQQHISSQDASFDEMDAPLAEKIVLHTRQCVREHLYTQVSTSFSRSITTVDWRIWLSPWNWLCHARRGYQG